MKYTKQWLLDTEPYIICDNDRQLLEMCMLLFKMGFAPVGNQNNNFLTIDIFEDCTFTLVSTSIVRGVIERAITATDFLQNFQPSEQ